MRFRFGDFVLDTQCQELDRMGVPIPLEPKAFQVLRYLLTQRDQAVSKEELLEACWKGEFVTDSAIARCLKVIRHTVDDDGVKQHTIKTLRSYGYRFIAPVEVSPPLTAGSQDQAEWPFTEPTNSDISSPSSHDMGAGERQGTQYAILIGNGHYPFDEHLSELRAPERDVEGLADALAHAQIAQFQVVQRLKNESHRHVLDTLLGLLPRAQKNDLVLVYFSGHARLDAQGRVYLACTNTQSHLLETTSLALDQIKDAIDTCLSTRILLILDCCFSSVTGASISPDMLDEQMRWLASGRGKYILSAAPDALNVQDKQTATYSLLTTYLIEGLSTGNADLDGVGAITVDQLYQYALSKSLEEAFPEPMRWDPGGKGRLMLARTRQRLTTDPVFSSTAVKAHYGAITQLLKKGDVIPCLGPGVMACGMDVHPPIDADLTQCLADSTGFVDRADPLTLMSQKIDIIAGRGVLYENLRTIYQPDPYLYHPTLIHRFLARLPQPLVMISTTYDALLEDAFDEVDKKYVVLTHLLHADTADWGKVAVQYSDRKETVEKCPAQELVIDLSEWSVIYKIQGTFGLFDADADEEIDSLVVSEEDHIALLKLLDHPQSTIPNHLARQFKKRLFLFLGYGISEWNVRAMVDIIQGKDNFRRIQPYVVHEFATEFERLYWESKRVRLLETELHAFIRELASAMGIDV